MQIPLYVRGPLFQRHAFRLFFTRQKKLTSCATKRTWSKNINLSSTSMMAHFSSAKLSLFLHKYGFHLESAETPRLEAAVFQRRQIRRVWSHASKELVHATHDAIHIRVGLEFHKRLQSLWSSDKNWMACSYNWLPRLINHTSCISRVCTTERSKWGYFLWARLHAHHVLRNFLNTQHDDLRGQCICKATVLLVDICVLAVLPNHVAFSICS